MFNVCELAFLLMSLSGVQAAAEPETSEPATPATPAESASARHRKNLRMRKEKGEYYREREAERNAEIAKMLKEPQTADEIKKIDKLKKLGSCSALKNYEKLQIEQEGGQYVEILPGTRLICKVTVREKHVKPYVSVPKSGFFSYFRGGVEMFNDLFKKQMSSKNPDIQSEGLNFFVYDNNSYYLRTFEVSYRFIVPDKTMVYKYDYTDKTESIAWTKGNTIAGAMWDWDGDFKFKVMPKGIAPGVYKRPKNLENCTDLKNTRTVTVGTTDIRKGLYERVEECFKGNGSVKMFKSFKKNHVLPMKYGTVIMRDGQEIQPKKGDFSGFLQKSNGTFDNSFKFNFNNDKGMSMVSGVKEKGKSVNGNFSISLVDVENKKIGKLNYVYDEKEFDSAALKNATKEQAKNMRIKMANDSENFAKDVWFANSNIVVLMRDKFIEEIINETFIEGTPATTEDDEHEFVDMFEIEGVGANSLCLLAEEAELYSNDEVIDEIEKETERDVIIQVKKESKNKGKDSITAAVKKKFRKKMSKERSKIKDALDKEIEDKKNELKQEGVDLEDTHKKTMDELKNEIAEAEEEFKKEQEKLATRRDGLVADRNNVTNALAEVEKGLKEKKDLSNAERKAIEKKKETLKSELKDIDEKMQDTEEKIEQSQGQKDAHHEALKKKILEGKKGEKESEEESEPKKEEPETEEKPEPKKEEPETEEEKKKRASTAHKNENKGEAKKGMSPLKITLIAGLCVLLAVLLVILGYLFVARTGGSNKIQEEI